MASYTTNPLPIIDKMHDHTGFILLSGFIGFIILVIWAHRSDYYNTYFANYVLIWIAIIAYPAYISFTTGEIITPKNEQVICEFVGFWGENHTETQQSGKTTRTIDIHNQYVIYRTPDGNISLKMAQGIAYPDKIIMYRN